MMMMMIGVVVVVEWRRVLDRVGSVGSWGFRVRFVEDWILGLQDDLPSLKFGGKKKRKIYLSKISLVKMWLYLFSFLRWTGLLIFLCPREGAEGCKILSLYAGEGLGVS